MESCLYLKRDIFIDSKMVKYIYMYGTENEEARMGEKMKLNGNKYGILNEKG